MFYKTAKWHIQEKSLRDNKQHKTNRCAYSVADHVMYIYVDNIFFFTIFVVQQPVVENIYFSATQESVFQVAHLISMNFHG